MEGRSDVIALHLQNMDDNLHKNKDLNYDDEPSCVLLVGCFVVAFLISFSGLGALVFAIACAQAILNKTERGKAIGISALFGSGLALCLIASFILKR